MKTIKAYTSYDEYENAHYYTTFEVVDRLPRMNEEYHNEIVTGIEEVELDCENDCKVYEYKYYCIESADDEMEYSHSNVAISLENLHKYRLQGYSFENKVCSDDIEELKYFYKESYDEDLNIEYEIIDNKTGKVVLNNENLKHLK